jgi:hypothetical protein
MRFTEQAGAGPQSEELGAQQLAMVIGQRAWTNQSQVSAHNVPYLGQVVDAVMAKPRAYDGQDARVVGITVKCAVPGRRSVNTTISLF